MRHSRIALGTAGVIASALFALPLAAQSVVAGAAQQGQPTDPKALLATESYLKPPAVVERIVAANRSAAVSFTNPSPDRKWFLKLENDGLPSLSDFAKGHIYLGGLQVDTMAFRARTLTTRGNHSITLLDAMTGKPRTIEAVKDADISSATWSPDGKTIAYVANFKNASHIVLLDVATGKATQLTKTPLNAVHVTAPIWSADGGKITTVLVPQPFKPAPPEPAVATTPIVRMTNGVDKERIHPSLLENPHDKDLLEYYSTGQLAVIDVKTKLVKNIGKPAMIRSVNPSPDASYFRVTTMTKPFSYVVPMANFGSDEQMWDATGKLVVQMAKRPLREGNTQDSTQADSAAAAPDTSLAGKTILGWNPLGPGILVVSFDPKADSIARAAAQAAQAANANGRGGRGTGGGGGAGRGAPPAAGATQGRGGFGGGGAAATGPSKLAVWMPPYGASDLKPVYASSARISAATYTADGKTLFVTVGTQTYAMRLADTTKHYALQNVTIAAGGGGGRGGRGGGGGAGGGRGGAGNTATVATRGAFVAMGSDNKTLFLSGSQAPGAQWQDRGPKAWVEKMDMETGTRSRIWEGADGAVEALVSPLDDDYSKVIVSRETPTEIGQSYLIDMTTKTRTPLTHNVDFAPEVTGAIRKRLWATRPDGFKFQVDVTLPRDYKEGTRLPGIIWFYPTEVSTQQAYDQARQAQNINRFPPVAARSAEIWTTQGYVVIQPLDIPVFGPQGSMNDHYIEELRDGLFSTIETVVNAGYLDRDRVGLWGHSYGAFSTVNAMVHTKWFKAGIAGDGMYNRSLTPYGFQRESRDFWQAQDTYLKMSPFFYADQLSGALLMYHQVEDQNEGTDPISSIRMFHALMGQGKTAALYMYPYEDHGPATKETDLDQWARFIAWFDIYVKNAKKGPIVP